MPAVPAIPSFAQGIISSTRLNALGFAVNFSVRRPAWKARRSGTSSVATSASAGANVQNVSFDVFDYDNCSATSSGTTQRLPYSGLWIVAGYVEWDSNATGWRRLLINHSGSFAAGDTRAAVSGDATHQSALAVVVATAGDTIALGVEQNSGTSRTLSAEQQWVGAVFLSST